MLLTFKTSPPSWPRVSVASAPREGPQCQRLPTLQRAPTGSGGSVKRAPLAQPPGPRGAGCQSKSRSRGCLQPKAGRIRAGKLRPVSLHQKQGVQVELQSWASSSPVDRERCFPQGQQTSSSGSLAGPLSKHRLQPARPLTTHVGVYGTLSTRSPSSKTTS